ncbi:MAG: penicillin-binding protein 2 [Clostridia bacterium]
MVKRRTIFLGFIIAVSILMLIFRVVQLQLLEGDAFSRASFQQRLRLLSTPAPRGKIVSGDGTVLAENRPAFVAQYIPSGEPPSEEWMNLVGFLTDVPPKSIEEAIRRGTAAIPYAPVDLKVDLSQQEYTALLEHKDELPGLRVISRPVRDYPEGDLASHIIGYVLKIGEDELRTFGDLSQKNYDNSHLVGKTGVERAAEFDLQGDYGEVRVEVNADGRLVNSITGRSPVPGNDVHLTIDTSLQRVLQDALETSCERLQDGLNPLPYNDTRGGYVNLWDEGTLRPADTRRPDREYADATAAAGVVLDVNTGAVLAMGSYPGFDLNVFATAPLHLSGTEEDRIWSKEWERLNDPERGQPLLNRATSQVVAPGSTFKMVTSLAYLETGGDPNRTESCPGHLDMFGQRYGCWGVHGSGVDLHRAIAESCNVYFYRAGLSAGIDAIEDMAEQLGLGDRTQIVGLDPSEESSGIRPGREWKQSTIEDMWYPGETLMAAIGQGYHAYTPLQMANYVATIASGGVRYRPFLIDLVVDPEGDVVRETEAEVMHRLDVDPESLARVRRAMEATVEAGGTSRSRFWDYPKKMPGTDRTVNVATKTGTAEVGGGTWRKDSHGWFVAYAPADDPEIAMAVVVNHGGGGSLAGAPIARMLVEEYFGFWREPEPAELLP